MQHGMGFVLASIVLAWRKAVHDHACPSLHALPPFARCFSTVRLCVRMRSPALCVHWLPTSLPLLRTPPRTRSQDFAGCWSVTATLHRGRPATRLVYEATVVLNWPLPRSIVAYMVKNGLAQNLAAIAARAVQVWGGALRESCWRSPEHGARRAAR